MKSGYLCVVFLRETGHWCTTQQLTNSLVNQTKNILATAQGFYFGFWKIWKDFEKEWKSSSNLVVLS